MTALRVEIGEYWSRASWLERVACLLLLAAAIIEIAAVFLVKVDGYDGSFVMLWIRAWMKLYDQGAFYPRWLPDSYGGLGSPAFYFYPPLAFFLAGGIHLILPVLSADALFHSVGLLGTVASFFASYYFLRQCDTARVTAIAGALFYTFAPFRFFDLYTRNGIGEHLGFAFLPLFFFAIYSLLHRADWRSRNFVLLAVSWSAIILSNVPLCFVAAIAGTVYAMIFGWGKWNRLLLVLGSAVLGTCLSAFYLLPIVHFEPYVQMENIWILIGRPRVPDYVHFLFMTMRNYTMAIQCTLCDLALIVLLVVSFRASREADNEWRRRFALASFLIAVLVLVIQLPVIGDPLFARVKIFQVIQFVWRFYIVVLLLAAFWFANSEGWGRRLMAGLAAVLAIAAVGAAAILIAHFRVHPKPPYWTEFDPPEYASVHTIPDVNEVVRLSREHRNEPFFLPNRSVTPGESLVLTRRTPKALSVAVRLAQPMMLTIHQTVWPDWVARIGDSSLIIQPDSIGRASFELPTGTYELRLRLERSASETAGDVISLSAAVVLIGIGAAGSWGRRKVARTENGKGLSAVKAPELSDPLQEESIFAGDSSRIS